MMQTSLAREFPDAKDVFFLYRIVLLCPCKLSAYKSSV